MADKSFQLFWTEHKLRWMKTHGLPNAETLEEALESATQRFSHKGRLTKPAFTKRFKKLYKKTPGFFLKKNLATAKTLKDPADLKDDPDKLRSEIDRLKKELATANAQALTAYSVKLMLKTLVRVKLNPPKWTYIPAKTANIQHGIPTILCSDWHIGETIFKNQVDGVNEFNKEIFHLRTERLFTRSVYLLDHGLSKTNYEGIVLAIAGDLLSGNIHEELRETNWEPVFKTTQDLVETLMAGIHMLKAKFKRVFIPWVVGNHGRIDKKPRAKNAVYDNYEWNLAQQLHSRFLKDTNVHFQISDSFTTNWKIYSTRYFMTHGDDFRGGSGISGPILPWTLGEHRLRKQRNGMSWWTGLELSFDVLVFGHWHTRHHAPTFISNGCLCGFNEYTKKKGYPFQDPQQSLWLTSPDRGITWQVPILLEDRPSPPETSWLSVLNSQNEKAEL